MDADNISRSSSTCIGMLRISLDTSLEGATHMGSLLLLWSTLCELEYFVPRFVLECGVRMGMLPYYLGSGTVLFAGLQCCAALAPADLYVSRILERFGLSSYLSLNPEWSSSMFLIFPFLSWSDFLRFMFLCAMCLHVEN